jgi:hypothetical protein
VACALVLLLVVPSPTEGEWDNAVVDTLTDDQLRKETVLQSLALDSLGHVHLVWKRIREGGGWRIRYSTTAPSGVWSEAEDVSDPAHASYSPALAVSPVSGHPFVAFEDGSEIHLAHRSGSAWRDRPITSNSTWDGSPTIASDGSGLVHLAWITDDPGSGQYKIGYAFGDTVSCDIQTLTGSELGPYGSGAAPHVAVSSEGLAHIVYRGGTYGGYHIHHAWNDSPGGVNWQYETLFSGNANDFSSALVTEDDGDMHLVMSGNDGWGLPCRVYYLYKEAGQSWQAAELVSLSYSATSPSLSVDISGRPHVAWMEISGNICTGDIFYSSRAAGGGWDVSPVIGGDHFVPSLDVDQAGYGHLACHTGGNTGSYDIYCLRSGEALTSLPGSPDDNLDYSSYQLVPNWPNPFNALTTVGYGIRRAGAVTIRVHDLKGRLVRTLLDAHVNPGEHEVVWDGKADRGEPVASGVYFVRLQAGGEKRMRKVLLAR